MVVIDGTARTEISEHLGQGTNNIAELTAIERVLDVVPELGRPLVIHTDSAYAIGVLSKGWKAKANLALIERFASGWPSGPRRGSCTCADTPASS